MMNEKESEDRRGKCCTKSMCSNPFSFTWRTKTQYSKPLPLSKSEPEVLSWIEAGDLSAFVGFRTYLYFQAGRCVETPTPSRFNTFTC